MCNSVFDIFLNDFRTESNSKELINSFQLGKNETKYWNQKTTECK